MATNQATIAVLEARPIPADMQCILPPELLDAIVAYARVAGLASQIASPTGVTPITNNIGQQALNLANELQVLITTLQGKTVERRTVAKAQNVNQGDSIQDFVISPAMPTTDYQVFLEFSGSGGHPSAYYGWRTVTGSKTTSGFQISFDNIPQTTLITVCVQANQNVQA